MKSKHTALKRFRNIVKMIAYVFRCAPLFVILSFIAAGLTAAEGVVCNALLLNFLYNALAQRLSLFYIFTGLALVGLLLLIRCLLSSYLEEIVRPRSQIILKTKMQPQLCTRATQIDLYRYDNPEYYDSLFFAVEEADTRAMACFDTLVQLFSCLLMLVGYTGVMLALDPFVLIPAGLFFAVSSWLNFRRAELGFARTAAMKPEERRSDYANRVFYLPDYAKELRLTGISEVISGIFQRAVTNLQRIVRSYGKKLTRIDVLDEVLCQAVLLNGGLYAYLAYALMVAGTIQVGGMMALAMSAENIIWRANDVIALIPKFSEHALYAEAFLHFLEEEERSVSGTIDPPLEGTVELHGLSFSYGENPPVLDGVDLALRPGEKIVLVGENGAGKSTLVKLLLGLYQPTGGEIHYAGLPIAAYDNAKYQSRFSCCFQDFKIYAATLGQNVSLSPEYDAERVYAALSHSGLESRLSNLPNGLESILTKEFSSEGVTFSGGEMQKLAMARVFYQDAPILVLDEPSSALDPIAELELNRIIFEAAEGKTVLFISHRLAAAVVADRVCVLKSGRIVEQGTHMELLQKRGIYAQMWKAQAGHYQQKSTGE